MGLAMVKECAASDVGDLIKDLNDAGELTHQKGDGGREKAREREHGVKKVTPRIAALFTALTHVEDWYIEMAERSREENTRKER